MRSKTEIQNGKMTSNFINAPASGNPVLRIGVDTGGTFTDIFAMDDQGRQKRWKILSAPDDPARAILQGVAELFPDLDLSCLEMVHGTTVGTNAFLERKGAGTVLLTTYPLCCSNFIPR